MEFREHEPDINIREVKVSNEQTLQVAADLISEYSWGRDYPVAPIEELRQLEFGAGAFEGDNLVGFAGVSKVGSPDGVDNGQLWFGYTVVKPEFRQRGIYGQLYNSCMGYMRGKPSRKLACTDNPIMEKFLLEHGWREIRKTFDEAGDKIIVFETQQE